MVNLFNYFDIIPFPQSTETLDMKNLLSEYKVHDDAIKWKHFPRYLPFVRGIQRFPVNSPHKGQWRGALMFSLICVWISGWVNNREAGDLRRYHAHCDVIVMIHLFRWSFWSNDATLLHDIADIYTGEHPYHSISAMRFLSCLLMVARAPSQYKMVISIIKIRRSLDSLIQFINRIHLLVRRRLYIETANRGQLNMSGPS